MTAAAEGEYEPTWLGTLRREAPEISARFFDGDQTAVTRFDEMMSMVRDDSLKLDLLRWAYNVKANPNDQMFVGMFIALRIQKASDVEIERVYETIRATNNEARNLLEEVRLTAKDVRTTAAVVGGQTDALNETITTLPIAIRSANEAALRESSAQLKEIAKSEARIELGTQARETTAEIENNLRSTRETVGKMMTSLKDLSALAHMIGEEKQLIFLGFIRTTKRSMRSWAIGTAMGAVLATLVFGFAVNATGLGLAADTARFVREGKTYEMMWYGNTASRACIRSWIALHP